MSSGPAPDSEWVKWIANTESKLPRETSEHAPADLTASDVAQLIDHTLLAPTATAAQIGSICREASEYHFPTVCVRPEYVSHAHGQLKRFSSTPTVGIASVIGFPEGTVPTTEKVAEAKQAVADGATELDMVLNYEALKEKRYADVYDDILAVRQSAPAPRTILKVILETSQLDRSSIIAGCIVCCRAGADFVKTCTGFRGRGASVDDVKLMRSTCNIMQEEGATRAERVRVKASGGIRCPADVRKMLAAGAERIGASAGVTIIDEMNAHALLVDINRTLRESGDMEF